jgi:hypothetical protein
LHSANAKGLNRRIAVRSFGKYAKVAQLVEHDLAKVGVASSSLVFRSKSLLKKKGFIFRSKSPRLFWDDFREPAVRPRLWVLQIACSGGGTGRHAGLKILFPSKECGFDSRPEYFFRQVANFIGYFFYVIDFISLIDP